jgi:hypothetical protein
MPLVTPSPYILVLSDLVEYNDIPHGHIGDFNLEKYIKILADMKF